MKQNKAHYVMLYITLPDTVVKKRSLLRARSKEDIDYIKKRILWHKNQVSKSVEYFKDHVPFKVINGNQPISRVTVDIHKALVGFLEDMTS
jgi:adenylate kinase family enzyme